MGNQRTGFGTIATAVSLGVLTLTTSSAFAQTLNYLIVTAPDYNGSAALNTFIAHKTALGYNVTTYVVPVGTSNTSIRTYIHSLWGGADSPAFVLLVGDTDGATSGTATIPHFTGGGSKGAPTDWPYVCMGTGDDWQPEIPIGRFSVRDTTQLQAVVDKTVFVEQGDFPDPEYSRRAAFLATDDSSALAEQTHEWVISTYLTPTGYYEPIRIYAAQGGDTADVTNAINNGCLWVNYFGHSTSSGWWAPAFSSSNVNALANEGLYGLAFGFSCNTANYPITECVGETWIRAPMKGSAAYISASTYIYYGGDAWESSRRLEKYFWQSFFLDRAWQIGPALRRGVDRLVNDPAFDTDTKRNMLEMFVILGDPSLKLPRFQPGPIPVARLRVPNGGESWTVGEQYEIRWSAYDDVAVTAIDLYLSTDGGLTYPVTIATGLSNSGTYGWTIPSYYAHQCRVKVVAHDGDGHTAEDASNADFTITPFGPRAIYDFPMNISPGWTTQPQWAFGVPTGGGGQQGCPDPTGGHTGSNVYGYNLNGAYEPSMTEKYLTTPALNLTGFTSTRLAFWRWLGVEDPTWDHAKVQVSVNGTSWTTVWENTGTIADGAWVYQEINIASIADNHAAVYIRWVMGPSDSLYQYCGWNIDDVQITGIAPVVMGDLNCDGVLNMSDIGPFALALIDPAGYAVSYPECTQFLADINEDGQRDGRDIQEFVTALLGG